LRHIAHSAGPAAEFGRSAAQAAVSRARGEDIDD
jgi:hypothetical protein